MTISEVLNTKRRRAKAIVRNNGKPRMAFPQIQFTSDCIRRYAYNRGKRLDEALAEVQRYGSMELISAMFANNPIPSAAVAAKRLEREMHRR